MSCPAGPGTAGRLFLLCLLPQPISPHAARHRFFRPGLIHQSHMPTRRAFSCQHAGALQQGLDMAAGMASNR